MFVYRHLQAHDLLELPEYMFGNSDPAQDKEVLNAAIQMRQPTTALALFLHVVALEDFIREFGVRLAAIEVLQKHFKHIAALAMKRKPSTRLHSRRDEDPTSLLDPEQVNELYFKVFQVQPIDPKHHARLRDLALVRHIVAHHGSIVRSVDVPRFQYYAVAANRALNPTVPFVVETGDFLFKIGIAAEEKTRRRVFEAILGQVPNWRSRRPPDLELLFEQFNFFGFLETARGPVGALPSHEFSARRAVYEKEQRRIRCVLVERCFDWLEAHIP